MGGSTPVACIGLPMPRSSRLLIAAMTVFGGTPLPRISSASLRIASSENSRASAVISCTCFGRPPGLPDWPFWNGLPLGLRLGLAVFSLIAANCSVIVMLLGFFHGESDTFAEPPHHLPGAFYGDPERYLTIRP